MGENKTAEPATREAERLSALYDQNVEACQASRDGKTAKPSQNLADPIPSQALSAPVSQPRR